MKVSFALSALLIAGTLFPCMPTEAKSPKSEVKVMSYNIRLLTSRDKGDFAWDARKESSITMINREKPDVIGYQEPQVEQCDYLAEQLPQYDSVRADSDAGLIPRPEYLMLMWLKDKVDLVDWGYFWVSETPDVVSKGWDAKYRRIVIWVRLKDKSNDNEFYCYNTHLDHIGEKARSEGAKKVIEKVKEMAGEKTPVFLVGDMNDEIEGDIASFLDWFEYARTSAKVTDNRPTFNNFGKKFSLIDHIFYRNAKPLRYETLDGTDYGKTYISDHYPIIATFKF